MPNAAFVKTKNVQKIFTAVAEKYDIANAILSFGMHKLWKRKLVKTSGAKDGDKILDLASGTGDIALLFAKKRAVEITALDLNEKMLEIAEKKAAKARLAGKINFIRGDAQDLPFSDNRFDVVSVGFGLRNVENLDKSLSEIRRVLKPGGKFLCLEFSRPPSKIFSKPYDFYSFRVLPRLGALITGEKVGAYRYLISSIRQFPSQKKFAEIITNAGFKNVGWKNLTFGIVAIHFAEK